MNSGLWKKIAAPITVVLGLYVVGYLFLWQWMVCRVYVEPNASLRLTYKGPFLPFLGSVEKADPGTLVQVDSSGRPLKIGVLEMMPGAGPPLLFPPGIRLGARARRGNRARHDRARSRRTSARSFPPAPPWPTRAIAESSARC